MVVPGGCGLSAGVAGKHVSHSVAGVAAWLIALLASVMGHEPTLQLGSLPTPDNERAATWRWKAAARFRPLSTKSFSLMGRGN